MIVFRKKDRGFCKFISAFIILTFSSSLIVPPSYAQSLPVNLPVPGAMVTLSPEFTPVLIKGIKVHPENPLEFDFIVDTGDSNLAGEELKEESKKLIKYFLASLTTPEEELWVNLSPYEEGRIVPDKLGATELGRDLLAQDYLLKQLTASLIYPEDELGKKFWDRVKKLSYERYGTTDIPMETFNKVWIVPQEAVVYENGDVAFVVKSRLKVMMEEDYVAAKANGSSVVSIPSSVEKPNANDGIRDAGYGIRTTSSEILKELIIPEIEKEINEGKNFALLRQIYHSVILSGWFKTRLKESLVGQVYADQNKTAGINLDDPTIKEQIYAQYLEAYKKGVYNYIKEDEEYFANTVRTVPRKYFSGGLQIGVTNPGLGVAPVLRFVDRPNAVQGGTVRPQGTAHAVNMMLAEPEEVPVMAEILAAQAANDNFQEFEDVAMVSAELGLDEMYSYRDPLDPAKSAFGPGEALHVNFKTGERSYQFRVSNNTGTFWIRELTQQLIGGQAGALFDLSAPDSSITFGLREDGTYAQVEGTAAEGTRHSEFITFTRDGLDHLSVQRHLVLPAMIPATAVESELVQVDAALVAEHVDVLAQRVTTKHGALTGRVHISDAVESGANGILAGHSEVRAEGETNDEINAQLIAAHREYGLTRNILAVGETAEEKDAGRSKEVVERDIREGWAGLTGEEASGNIVAYEPRWAIGGSGTGQAATAEDAQEMAAFIRSVIAEMYGWEVALKVRILYGGSADGNNAESFLSQKDVDGLLVGGKSTSVADLRPILEAAAKVGPTDGRVPYIGGNWKTYQIKNVFAEFAELFIGFDPQSVQIAVAPSFAKIGQLRNTLNSEKVVEAKPVSLSLSRSVLAQRVTTKHGALTGRVHINDAVGAGANGILAGHSEVRAEGETNEEINAQMIAAHQEYGLTGNILAVGETAEEKNAGKSKEVVGRDVRAGVEGLTGEEVAGDIIAYEPRWAIGGSGTGQAATAEDAQEMAAFIRSVIAELYGDEVARKVRILYGGSADGNNAESFLSQKDVDGLLVGGKSTSVNDLRPILEAAAKVGPTDGRVPYIGGNWKTYQLKSGLGNFAELFGNFDPQTVQIAIAPALAKVTTLANILADKIELNVDGKQVGILEKVDALTYTAAPAEGFDMDSQMEGGTLYFEALLEFLESQVQETGHVVNLVETSDPSRFAGFLKGRAERYAYRNKATDPVLGEFLEFKHGSLEGTRKVLGSDKQDPNRVFHLEYRNTRSKSERSVVLTFRDLQDVKKGVRIIPKRVALLPGFGTINGQTAAVLSSFGYEVIAANRSANERSWRGRLDGHRTVPLDESGVPGYQSGYRVAKGGVEAINRFPIEYDSAGRPITMLSYLTGEGGVSKADIVVEGFDGKAPFQIVVDQKGRVVAGADGKIMTKLPADAAERGLKLEKAGKVTWSQIFQAEVFDAYPDIPKIFMGSNDPEKVADGALSETQALERLGLPYDFFMDQENIECPSCNVTSLITVTLGLLAHPRIKPGSVKIRGFVVRRQGDRLTGKAGLNPEGLPEIKFNYHHGIDLIKFLKMLRKGYGLDLLKLLAPATNTTVSEYAVTTHASMGAQQMYHIGNMEIVAEWDDGSPVTAEDYKELIKPFPRVALVKTGDDSFDTLLPYKLLFDRVRRQHSYVIPVSVVQEAGGIGVTFLTPQESNVIPNVAATAILRSGIVPGNRPQLANKLIDEAMRLDVVKYVYERDMGDVVWKRLKGDKLRAAIAQVETLIQLDGGPDLIEGDELEAFLQRDDLESFYFYPGTIKSRAFVSSEPIVEEEDAPGDIALLGEVDYSIDRIPNAPRLVNMSGRAVTPPNEYARKWIQQTAAELGAREVVILGEDDQGELFNRAIEQGILEEMRDGNLNANSHPQDVARSVARTKILTDDSNDRGVLNNWDYTSNEVPKMEGRMKAGVQLVNGRLYLLPVLTNRGGSRNAEVTLMFTTSEYVVANTYKMAAVGRHAVGASAWRQLGKSDNFLKAIHVSGNLNNIKRTGDVAITRADGQLETIKQPGEYIVMTESGEIKFVWVRDKNNNFPDKKADNLDPARIQELLANGRAEGVPIITIKDNEDVKIITDKEDERLFAFDPRRGIVWSYGSDYGGNAILSKKFIALRYKIFKGIQTGETVTEHMALLVVTHKKTGKRYGIALAAPSQSGKTTFSNLVPPEILSDEFEIQVMSDDIISGYEGEDGYAYFNNEESGMFIVAYGVNWETSPNLMTAIEKGGNIGTNLAFHVPTQTWWWEDKTKFAPHVMYKEIKEADGTVRYETWWVGKTEAPPQDVEDLRQWEGKEIPVPTDLENWKDYLGQSIGGRDPARLADGWIDWKKNKLSDRTTRWQRQTKGDKTVIKEVGVHAPLAEPNSRITIPIENLPNLSPSFYDPRGVPLHAVLWGGKVARLKPTLVIHRNVADGIHAGASMIVQKTAAEERTGSDITEDLLAERPFLPVPEGVFLGHELDFYESLENPPVFADFNPFRVDENGKFIFVGFRETLRVIKALIQYLEGEIEPQETAIGLLVKPEDWDLRELDDLTTGQPATRESAERMDAYDPNQWLTEVTRRAATYAKWEAIGPQNQLPAALYEANERMRQRLLFEGAVEGDVALTAIEQSVTALSPFGLGIEPVAQGLQAAVEQAQQTFARTGRLPDVQKRPVGGIDLNKLNLQIKRDGNGVPLPVNLQDLEKIQAGFQGFLPVIIDVVPVNLPLLLGLSGEESEDPRTTKGGGDKEDRGLPVGDLSSISRRPSSVSRIPLEKYAGKD